MGIDSRELYDIYQEAKSKVSLNGVSIMDYRDTSAAWTKGRHGVSIFLSDGSIINYYPTKIVEFDEILKMDFDKAFDLIKNIAWLTKFKYPTIVFNDKPVRVVNAEILDSTSFIANFIVNGSEIQICRKRETKE